jgi:hypothetical protein
VSDHDDDRAPRSPQLRFEGQSPSLGWLIRAGADPAEAPPVTLTFPPGVELMTDVSPAAWAEERLMALLFRGPIDVMTATTNDRDLGWPDYPQLWWPDDRAWCVATDIDLDSTFVGATEEGVASLLAEPRLEVVPAAIDDRT